jgi:hypothetical protein
MKSLLLCLAALIAFALPAAAEDAEEATPIDWSRVDFDALSLLREARPSANAPRLPAAHEAATWNRTENRNGSANVALKQSWAPGIATQVGVDSVGSQPGWSPPGALQPPSGGVGWASAAIPGIGPIDQATLDARLDPESDQRKFGARISKSIPLNEQVSVTVQNGYGVSQPLAPVAGAAPPSQVIDSDQLAKLNFLPLGTSLFAGSKISSIDDRRLNSLGAEQNLLGGISLSGAVSENASGGHDRSLTARFKRSW